LLTLSFADPSQARANYNLVVRQGDTPVTEEKVEENVSFVTEEH